MEDAKYIELAAKYLSGDMSATERRKLMEWIALSDANQAFFDEMIHLWSLTADAEQEFKADTAVAWDKVAARINAKPLQSEEPGEAPQRPQGKILPLSIKRNLLRIAAVLLPLLLIGGWWLLQPRSPDERLIFSEDATLEVELPDGSSIWLNKNSSLAYHGDFTERKVSLEGEAFFEIAKDSLRPFEIYSGETVTRVLGTSFNIRAYPEEQKVEVTVTTGIVAFEERADETDSATLTAGQAAVYLKAQQEVRTTTSRGTNARAWMTKEIDMENIPFGQLLETLNYYFDRKITVENPNALQCSTTLQSLKDPTLNEALEMIEEIFFLEVDSSSSEIKLIGEGCPK